MIVLKFLAERAARQTGSNEQRVAARQTGSNEQRVVARQTGSNEQRVVARHVKQSSCMNMAHFIFI